MPVGRPRKYTSVDELLAVAETYFQDRDAKEKPYTITGLALALGFSSRKELITCAELGEDYSHAITQLKTRCENYAESVILEGKAQAGGIFVLKNHGWRDDQGHILSGDSAHPVVLQHVVRFGKTNATEGEGSDG